MWLTLPLADAVPSDGTIAAIVVAAIGALGAVAVAWVTKGREPGPEPDDRTVTPAIKAAAEQGMESAADVYRVTLAREQAENEQLERTLTEVRSDRDQWMQRAYRKGWTTDDA